MKKRAINVLEEFGIVRTWGRAHWRIITDIKEWNDKVDYLKKNGQESTNKDAKSYQWFKPNTYRIDADYKPYYIHLFWTDENGELNVWKINSIQPKKKPGQGRIANKIEKELFEKFNGTTERKAFGYCDRATIGRCVPKQLYYIDKTMLNKNLEHVGKADYSSHYPACLCGRMPTMKNAVTVSGTVEPTEEYPFAFYINSGHSAELGVYDTHKWLDSTLVMWLFGDNYNPHIEPDEDVTILCKASEYNYDEVIQTLYKLKSDNAELDGIPVKLILNAAIGYKHLKNKNAKQNRLDHLAVVALCRANQKMLDLYVRGQTLMIVVDSIIYKGTDEVGIQDKKLGELHQEITDASFRMRGINQYAFEQNGQIIDFAHSGFDNIKEIKRLEDIDKFEKSDIIKIRK